MLLRISLLLLATSAHFASAERPNYHRSAPINPRLRSSRLNEASDNSALTCYTNTNAGGYYQDYDDYASSLGSYDNSYRSACMYGIWMWYDLQDYNMVDFNVRKYQSLQVGGLRSHNRISHFSNQCTMHGTNTDA